MNVAEFRRIFQLPQATDNNHAGFVDPLTFGQMEALPYSLIHPANLIPYLRFAKIIIDYYMTENPDISCRVHDNYQRVENDDLVKNIFNSGKNKGGAGMKIPDWMLIKAMKLTNYYKMYAAVFQVDVPRTQSQPIESTQGMHRTPSTPRSPNPVTTKEEEETVRDEFELKRRIKGKETLQVLTVTTEDAPSSANKEKIKELMVTAPSPSSSTPSSSLPKPKTGCFKRCKNCIHQMCGCYGLLFGHLTKTFMLKKNFNELFEMQYQALKEMLPSMVNREVNKIAKITIPIYVVEGLLLETQQIQDDVAAMIDEAIQKEHKNLRIEFENTTTATAYQPSAIFPRDHDDYRDDDAHPEGENNAKRQKISEHGTYSLGESSYGQAIEQEKNPLSLGTQEQLDEFDSWMEDAGIDDDEVPDDKVSQEVLEEMSGETDTSKQ
nr:hypothetical protein [Tanacetum cinerariifolium]